MVLLAFVNIIKKLRHGNIFTYNKLSVYICSASLDLIKDIQSMIDIKHCIITNSIAKQNYKPKFIRGELVTSTCDHYRISFNDLNALEFLNFMYENSTICLDRKKTKYQEAYAIWSAKLLNRQSL